MTADNISSARQGNSALKSTLRKFKAPNYGIAQLRRKNSMSADDQMVVVDDRDYLIGINPGQRNEDQYFPIRLQHVDRRLPGGRCGRLQAEQPGVEPFR